MSVETLPAAVEAADSATVHPWQRYFARMFDIHLFSMTIMVAIGAVGGIFAPEPTLRFLALMEGGFLATLYANVLAVGVTVPAIAIFGAWTGTPGKWLFDIRVREANGDRLSLVRSFRREAAVWIKGLGLGVPLVSLITLIMSKVRLDEDGMTSWDKAMGCRVTHAAASVSGYIKKTIGITVVLGMLVYNYVFAFGSIMKSIA